MLTHPREGSKNLTAEQRLDQFEVYLKSERVSPMTLKTYVPIVTKFLKKVKDSEALQEWDARDYLASLYDVKKNTSYVAYYALLKFYRCQGIPFDIPPPEMDEDPYRPSIKPRDVGTMITTIKEAGDPNQNGILALSTVYGLRRIEIRRAVRNDLNLEDNTITIHTAKKGRVSTHAVPELIVNYLIGYDFKSRSDTSYANIFWEMVRKSGLQLTKGYGFHSIRRALYTELSKAKIDYFIRHAFMRWRMRGLELDAIYDQSKIDKTIFGNHPFLKFWGV